MARLVVAVLTAVLILSATPIFAVTPISDNGSPGTVVFTDTESSPGARCQYAKTSGGMPLRHLNVFAFKVYGNLGDVRQSVGTRVWLQQKIDGQWVRQAEGELLTGQATKTAPVTLDPDIVYVPRRGSSHEGTWRATVKVIWYNKDASIHGWRMFVIDDYRTLASTSDGPEHVVRHVCRGGLGMTD